MSHFVKNPTSQFAFTSSTEAYVTNVLPGQFSFTFIGPDNPSIDKSVQDSEIKNIWEKLDIENFIENLFKSPLDLFREALACYQNGAYMASSIMCRTSIDSLLFIVVNTDIQKTGSNIELTLTPPLDAKGVIIRQNYKTILSHANKYLTNKQETWLQEEIDPNIPDQGVIRHTGDFVAHYTEKLMRIIGSKSTIKIKVDLWVDKTKAKDILEKTVDIFNTINLEYRRIEKI